MKEPPPPAGRIATAIPSNRLGLCLLTVMLAAFLPIVFQIFGTHFLPAPGWYLRIWPYALVIGVAWAALMSWLQRIENTHARRKRDKFSDWLIGFLGGTIGTVVTVPMVAALVFGGPVHGTHVVKNASSHDNRCERPIVLQNMPILFDSLCGYSDELRQHLVPGTVIKVLGTGTALGMFPEAIHFLPDGASPPGK